MNGITVTLAELIALKRYAQSLPQTIVHHTRQSGHYQSTIRGRGMDFAEARNYQAGDEIRHMEWRVTARTGRPHVKVYQEEKERPVMLLVDFSASMRFGSRIAFKSVVAARLAAVIAWTAAKQGDRVGGFLFSEAEHSEYTPRARQAGILPMLAGMHQYTTVNDREPNGELHPLNHALSRLRHVAKPGSVVALLSDFYEFNEDSERHLQRLAHHNDVMVYLICDPLEISPPKAGRYAITDGKQSCFWDVTRRHDRDTYEQACKSRLAMLNSQCNRLRIGYSMVTAETDLSYVVRDTLPWRRHGRI